MSTANTNPIEISKQTARRLIIGRQGLWPGRRWAGKEGAAQALLQNEGVQLDPLNIAARSQEIMLWARVIDYRPGHLDELAYSERRFFDYGALLYLQPIHELPYWRHHMRSWESDNRYAHMAAEEPWLIDEIRQALRERGPLGNRDFNGRKPVDSYRGRKDSSLALFYMWVTGEVLIHHRDNFHRIYDFRENIVPPELDYVAPLEEAEAYFARKAVSSPVLVNLTGWKNTFAHYLGRKVDIPEARRRLDALLESGDLLPLRVEGWKDLHYLLARDLPDLETVASGRIPEAWAPLDTTTDQEAVFLSPLESTSGRAKKIFDFDYLWDVYKPLEQRRWGYYNIPILYGEDLVAIFAPRMDRAAQTLVLSGFWIEDGHLAPNTLDLAEFAPAFARGLARFAGFLDAPRIDLSAVSPPEFKEQVIKHLRQESDRQIIELL